MQPCQRAKQGLINWNSNSQGNTEQDRFIPRTNLLQELFTSRALVRRILQCHEGNCNECGRDYKFICSGKGIRIKPGDELDRILPRGNQDDLTTSAISLFALLVKIGHPLLIVPLLEHGRNDSNTLESFCDGSFKFPKLREKYWKECRRKDDPDHEYSKMVAGLIQENLSIFFRPIFRDEKFHNLPETVKLPIYNEKQIGAGSFGKVFAFRIFEGHNKFATFGNVQHFARKVISRNMETDFLPGHQEGRNLSLVNALENPHIVQIVTSFTYRDEFSIVFRRATTNLEKALREPKYLLGQIVPPLRSCPLWPQMLGLAKALRDFSNGNWNLPSGPDEEDPPKKEAEDSRVTLTNSVAIHFDLKPSNILVNRPSRTPPTFDFIITDFGLAHIKDTTGGSSGTRDRGGDEAYAPPECMQDKQSRKYDIWSLGCIFLELLTFLVMGYEGVCELDKVRCGPSMRRARQNHCFWEEVAGSEDPVLKDGVEKFLLKLQERADFPGQYSSEEKRLIKNTILMIKKMLRTQPESRLTSSHVVWWLERIGRGYEMRDEQADAVNHDENRTLVDNSPHREHLPNHEISKTTTSQQRGPWWETDPRAEENVQLAERTDMEIEIEPKSLRSLRSLLIRSNVDPSEEDSNAILQVFAEDKGNLRFVVTSLNLIGQQPLEQNCPRQYVHLMAQYAFRKHHNTQRSDAGMRLVWSHDPLKPIMRYDFSGKLNDLRKIHGALLGQEIYHTIEVENVTVVRSSPWFRMNPKPDKTTGEKGPFTVQLWRERPPETFTERRRKPRACRLVIYFSTKIYVIPFHQYLRFPPRDEILEESLTVLKSGTVHGTRQTFDMTVLQAPEPPNTLPTFPLDASQLEATLTEGPVAFKGVTIDFRAHEDLYFFWNDYRVLKEDWLQEMGIKRTVVSNTAPVLKLDFA